MNKILLIGNSGTKSRSMDGQTVKVRLYLKKIKDEGFDVDFIDLESSSRRPISTFVSIYKHFKKCDRIILITAERGAKLLMPFINFINRKKKKPFILPLIGISVLHYSIDRLSIEEKNDFLLNGNYSLCQPNKMLIKQLKKISYILPETELLSKVFVNFYGLNNVYQLNNFRDMNQVNSPLTKENNGKLRLVFLSRVMEIKGILDLMDVIKQLNEKGEEVYLDIFGKKLLSDKENLIFESYLDCPSISYKGIVNNDLVSDTISKYDLFVFPTKYYGEGTPGVIVESLVAGVPVITSDFPQAKYLLKDGFDSLFYKMNNKKGLYDTIAGIIYNRSLIDIMKNNAFESGTKYTYNHERNFFLKYICGVGEE